MMGVQEYLEILRNIRDCAFATVDCTGVPAVRTACTADFVLKAVLWKRSKGWAARRID